MARVLIVGCGCHGRELGAALASDGWAVRGTSRSDEGVAAIEAAGLEGAKADPDRLGTVIDLIEDVAVIAWLMGSAGADANGDRLESLMLRLVDTPVRGLVYEARGEAPAPALERGRAIVEGAAERWRIRVPVLDRERGEAGWREAAASAVAAAIG